MVKRLQFLLFDQAVSRLEFEPAICLIPARSLQGPDGCRARFERHFDGWRVGPDTARTASLHHLRIRYTVRSGEQGNRAQKSMPVSRHFRPCDRVRGRKGEPAEERRHSRGVPPPCEDGLPPVLYLSRQRGRCGGCGADRVREAARQAAALQRCRAREGVAHRVRPEPLPRHAKKRGAAMRSRAAGRRARRPDGRRWRRDARGGARPSPEVQDVRVPVLLRRVPHRRHRAHHRHARLDGAQPPERGPRAA